VARSHVIGVSGLEDLLALLVASERHLALDHVTHVLALIVVGQSIGGSAWDLISATLSLEWIDLP
jgi:hypothetical protein